MCVILSHNHTCILSYSHTVIFPCSHAVILPYQVGEVVTCFSTHDPQWVTESGDVVDIRVEGLGAGVDDHEDERGDKLVSTGRTILGDPQGSCTKRK